MPRYVLDICRHYRQAGWDVAVFTRDAKAIDDPFRREGIRLLHAPLSGAADISSAFSFAAFLRSLPHGSAVVHAHSFRNAFTALLARKMVRRKDVKVVMTRHKVRKGSDSRLSRRIYRNLDAIIFVSEIAKARFLSTWHSRPLPFGEGKIHVVHNSIYSAPASIAEAETHRPVCAMFHGVIAPGKGLETLVDALPMLKGARMRVRIVGGGQADYIDRIRRRAITRGVMEMIDWRKHEENPLDLIASADFGVLPSVVEEAFGLANIEYMAMGKPQVCSSSGAQPEYITDGREGFLVPPANPAALADAMRKLASDHDLRIRMGERAAASFRMNLSWDCFARRLDGIYGDGQNDLRLTEP